jgi:hypothetical protein
MPTWSSRTLEILRTAGWREGRKAKVKEMMQALGSAGYLPHAAAEDFLNTFGGLELEVPDAVPPAAEDWHFRADLAAEEISRASIRRYEARLETTLCPIGQAFRDHMTLMMGADGAVYGAYDQPVWRIGASGHDAIEHLCNGVPLEPVGADDAAR